MDVLRAERFSHPDDGQTGLHIKRSLSQSNRLEAWTRDVPFLLRQEGRPVTDLASNLPHPYHTQSLGPTAGGSTFCTSPYWLQKVMYDLILLPKWLPLSVMHPVDYFFITLRTSLVTSQQRQSEAYKPSIMPCAETDAMLVLQDVHAGRQLPCSLAGHGVQG
ncbi:arylsulfatase K-like [Hypomesus transpacificus]|uniref:arylsulfatase K-like n=1 Tax=Hypomesus transpacificus TaxID=137520 RepID=UPI001F08712D|nr:arylsulfatase K-like [Hypomesus transpacificus]